MLDGPVARFGFRCRSSGFSPTVGGATGLLNFDGITDDPSRLLPITVEWERFRLLGTGVVPYGELSACMRRRCRSLCRLPEGTMDSNGS